MVGIARGAALRAFVKFFVGEKLTDVEKFVLSKSEGREGQELWK